MVISKSKKMKVAITGLLALFAFLVAWRLIVQTKKLAASIKDRGNIIVRDTKSFFDSSNEALGPTPDSVKPAEDNGNSFSLGRLIYPGSEITRFEGSRIYLKSLDAPDNITGWYKNKISGLGMNIKNFVQTNTNGQIKNQLNGVSSGERVNIEINKNPDKEWVEIIVNISITK